jgi:oxygen-dependent protoporphyrinogen oxidase
VTVGAVTDVAVIGGGIAGLAAAWELTRGGSGCRVTLVEASERLGGKIETAPFAGVELDGGPDAFLARVPAATQLVREAGLADDLVAPGTGQAWLWTRGRLRRLPTGLVLGVPVDLGALARSAVLPRAATARAALDLVLPGSPVGPDEDVAVGRLVRRRMGRSVQEGLVDPLLGGINAGHTDHLSAAVAAPQLLAAARRQASLVRALRAAGTGGSASGAITVAAPPAGRATSEPPPVVGDTAGLSTVGDGDRPLPGGHPVFLTVRGGLARLVDAVAAGLAASGCALVVGDPVSGLAAAPHGWDLRLASGRVIAARGVVVACPAPAAATLLRPTSPGAAADLAGVATASVALVSLAYPANGQPDWEGSGFLVPRSERRFITAASWVGQKWAHLAVPGRLLVRASAGRIDDERIASLDDDELADAVHRDVAAAMGLRGGPVERRVHRWPAAFPQYEVGHLERIDRLERRLQADAPGVALAGAALRGVGLATCIAGGRAAAERVRSHLATPAAPPEAPES